MSGVSPSRPNPTARMEALLSELPGTETLEMGLAFGHYGEIEAISTITPPNILLALHRAREARELAISHRKFYVGAAAVAISEGQAGFEIITGFNIKPEENSTINIHAETSAEEKTRKRKFGRISIIAIVGEAQNDQQSGHAMCTLHPCGLCRKALGESSLVDDDFTLIASATPDLRTMEAYNIRQVKQYHEDPDSIELARFELPDMKLLRPTEQSSGTTSPTRFIKTPEDDAEEQLWMNALGPFTASWRNRHLGRLGLL